MKTRKAAVRPAKLDIWQRRLADSDAAWKPEMERMDRREHLYSGDRELRALTKGDEGRRLPISGISSLRTLRVRFPPPFPPPR